MQIAQQSSLNIAIFGLSLKVLSEIKLAIEKLIPQNMSLNWINIADPKLNILMVNELFFDAPSIQKLIKNQNIRLLRLINNSNKHGQIEKDILYLPIDETVYLQDWLSKSTDTSEKNVKISSTQDSGVNRQDLYTIVKEILNPENGTIQVFDQNGILAMVDPRNQWAWVLPEHQNQTDTSLNTIYATMNDRQAFNTIQRQDLKNWLWNVLWRSTSFHKFVQQQDCFYLKQWPQPEDPKDRHDILRMSACFAQGANIITVAEKLGLSVDRVTQFVSTCLAVNLGSLIQKNQVKYPPQHSHSEDDAGVMRKFFGKLRRRLGF